MNSRVIALCLDVSSQVRNMLCTHGLDKVRGVEFSKLPVITLRYFASLYIFSKNGFGLLTQSVVTGSDISVNHGRDLCGAGDFG